MTNRAKVKTFGDNRVVVIDLDATEGAVVGTNLFWPDGTVVTVAQLRGLQANASGVQSNRMIATVAPILGGGQLSSDLVISHSASGVTPGSFTSADITVNQYGHVTAASNGTAGGTPIPTFAVYPPGYQLSYFY